MNLKFTDMVRSVPLDFSDTQPYVFEPERESPQDLEITDDLLAMPFPKISIEISDGFLTVDQSGGGFNIGVVFAEELGVDSYRFVYSIQVKGELIYIGITSKSVVVYKDGVVVTRSEDSGSYNSIKSLVLHYVHRLTNSRFGLFNAPGKARYKDIKGQKQVFKPNNVVYIPAHSVNNDTPRKVGVSGVVWQSSFHVASHWRKITEGSYGLDRYGERVVPGYTWIRSYMKGDGELAIKVRKVSSSR